MLKASNGVKYGTFIVDYNPKKFKTNLLVTKECKQEINVIVND